jgi:site-specific DNA-adenine methylase
MKKHKIPTFAYPGGKARLASWLVDMFPKEGNTYFEPFAGRGNVFWYAATKIFYNRWWLNDIRTKKFFDAIASFDPNTVIPARTREEYYKQWELYKQNNPLAILLEAYLTFGGGGYGSGGFGGAKGASIEGYYNSIINAQSIMRVTKVNVTDISWNNANWNEMLGSDDFVYLDPPYYQADVRAYKNNEINHRQMAEGLAQAKFKWLLSEYDCEMYRKVLGEPAAIKNVQLCTAPSLMDTKTRRIECVWRNY